MGRLMLQVIPQLESLVGGSFELIVLENDLFGARVTTAGLLPGRTLQQALQGRGDLDLALIPAEALNDDDRFIDDLTFQELRDAAPVEIRSSYDFADVLTL